MKCSHYTLPTLPFFHSQSSQRRVAFLNATRRWLIWARRRVERVELPTNLVSF
ncbi:MAG: hypothetical protein F6J93_20380 [Oscillatoria sp. SIO1A7]|nr:hypothetical protein [Oscillatoria sp. SIO1A7]